MGDVLPQGDVSAMVAYWKDRARKAEAERATALAACFHAAPTQWAELALTQAGFSEADIAAASDRAVRDSDA